MENIREINTKPACKEDVETDFSSFMRLAEREGTNLRMEMASGLTGRRFVVVFDWEDMG